MTNPFELIEAKLQKIEMLILDFNQKPNEKESQKESDELLTVKDTAIFLRLSVPTVYTLISKGELPVMKRSKRCYFSKFELMAYLKAGRKKTNSERSAEVDEFLTKKKGSRHE